MAFDPTKPANGALIVSAELRSQLTSLKTEIDTKTDAAAVSAQITNEAAGECSGIGWLGMTVSNPPTQAQVQTLANKIDDLISALRRA
ncbi:MAG: hypothetical protein EPO07_14295 [Verrucomicrobia bacterium]|nr:MAG: hypothetical protein EPO07_14295 [Verrucomicrobiota bacterium]